jgi:D-serine deaminase-like pyridoxal phosphate-dependent protein
VVPVGSVRCVPPDFQLPDRGRLDRATAHLEPPFVVVLLPAWRHNASDLARRAAGTPIRVASKSVRSRELLRDVLARPGFAGVMAYTLPEALWLVESDVSGDVLVAYPTVDRTAVRSLTASAATAAGVTLMVDDNAQLDLIDAVAPPARRPPVGVCIDLDASWRPLRGLLHLGVRRSPLHRPVDAVRLARHVVARPGFHLVGLMAYEAQIAGVADAPAGRRLRGAAVRAVQARSARELGQRRAETVAAIAEICELQFVNGGGTGSVERTVAEGVVSEVTAGSGLFAPALFDDYRAFRPLPSALLALPVVRRPGPGFATVLGGGYVASGAAGTDRLPRPELPAGLRLLRSEGAGEVQTPVRGRSAEGLNIGDRVWFRHAKAGELCEHVDVLHLLDGDHELEVVGTVATYRGERRTFL